MWCVGLVSMWCVVWMWCVGVDVVCGCGVDVVCGCGVWVWCVDADTKGQLHSPNVRFH